MPPAFSARENKISAPIGNSLCFRIFHAFSLKSLTAARKGMKHRKRGFPGVSASEFNTVK